MRAAFEIKRSVDGRFVFSLKAANDQVILMSQTYQTKENAEDGIAAVRQNAPLDERYEERTGDDKLPYFVLRAPNRQVIGKSQLYSSREAMRKGIASVKRNARLAEILDFTARVHSATAKPVE